MKIDNSMRRIDITSYNYINKNEQISSITPNSDEASENIKEDKSRAVETTKRVNRINMKSRSIDTQRDDINNKIKSIQEQERKTSELENVLSKSKLDYNMEIKRVQVESSRLKGEIDEAKKREAELIKEKELNEKVKQQEEQIKKEEQILAEKERISENIKEKEEKIKLDEENTNKNTSKKENTSYKENERKIESEYQQLGQKIKEQEVIIKDKEQSMANVNEALEKIKRMKSELASQKQKLASLEAELVKNESKVSQNKANLDASKEEVTISENDDTVKSIKPEIKQIVKVSEFDKYNNLGIGINAIL